MSATRPPTTDALALVGDGLAFTRAPTDAMERWATHGDLVRLRLPGRSMYAVLGPAPIEEILVEKPAKFSIGPEQRETFRGVEDHAVTTNTGERWKRLRRAMHPAFTREHIVAYGDRMAATTAEYVEAWEDGETVDLTEEMRRLAVNVLADALLDEDVRGDEAIVMEAADALVDRATIGRPGQLLPDWIPTPTDRRFERRVAALDSFVDELIADRQVGDSRDDVCSVLLAAREDGDLSLPEVRHNLVALLLAGHESPSGALTHALRLLDEHPDVLADLRAEYDAVVDGERPAGADYESLELTRNVVSETLRLYPPTTGVNRQATEPVTLGGYDLSEGAEFMIPQWVPHRDERWWDDPEAFDPWRWEGDADRPRFAYFPFSGGPRACIGDDFARRELTLALSTIVGRFDVDVSMDGPLSFTASLQLRPENDLSATVRRR